MKLLTKEVISRLPPLYTNEDKDPKDTPVIVKFFHPFSNWTWYVTEGEQKDDDWLFFGLVRGIETELGYFTLSQLEEIKIMGLPIERDRNFTGTLSEAKEKRI